MKYYIENFGCQMNDHDMEKVNRLLDEAGHVVAETPSGANLVIINTCCVRQKAEQKFYSLMGRLKGLKRKGAIIGVMGCIAQLEKDSLWERLPYVDFALGPANVHKVMEAVETAVQKRKYSDFTDNGCHSSLYVRPGNTSGKIKAYVTIMKGCDNFCSYCVVPFVRGREVSRPAPDIYEEIEVLAATGVKEVVLLGQNVNSYNGGEGTLFSDLLKKINNIKGIERIRFVTSHPRDLSDDLINCFGSLHKLCEQIHLPFQSGSNRILSLMNRGYTAEQYNQKVERLRSQCPEVAMTADCIVGFPGEDDSDFRATMALVDRIHFDGVFSFCYSPRKFTKAATLPDPIPQEIATKRLYELQAFQKEITMRQFRSLEGKTVEVLVEGMSKNSSEDFTGRTRTNRIVNFKGSPSMIGKLIDVEIVKGYANSLRGADLTHKEA